MQNSKFYRNIPFTFSRIKINAPTKVILEFYKSNINSLSKKDKRSILVQTFVYVLLSNPFIFGQTIKLISSLVFENNKWTLGGLLWAFQYVSPP